ncbi:metallophosphoesterase family protein [Faecalibacter bovis]|uniref:Phosphoesterase n=1 Tax=Faecalibacter bovis TaxID=2898187 RepID=A0ABX7XA43_9FLAO|nr:metallophosphoesterase family protein [Faecalibacter bovis]MBS7334470.1 metallophosphoesterase family protein [Weeksellaceae bacterium]QTV04760.1 metallophosphoesterase family protein [Faecalibacter bovis]
MKKILLLSDTHSYIDDRIIEYAKQADEIWHAGDIGAIDVMDQLEKIKPVRAVYGNIDDQTVRAVYPLNNRFTIEGVDVWITHIGGYPGKYNPKIRKEITENPPKVFICGHSHILKVMPDKDLGLIHLNPGAVGKHGFHQVRTMLRFDVNNGKLENLEVIEFKK